MTVNRLVVLLIVTLLVLVGCRQGPATSASAELQIELQVEPDPPQVGEAVMTITVLDAAGEPADVQAINVRGDMSHAGMVPVIRDVDEGENGRYEVPFEWTMGGDWFVEVTVSLANGETGQQRFDFSVAADGGMADHGGMDMDADAEE